MLTFSQKIGKKAENLNILSEYQNPEIYKVPFYLTVEIWQNTQNIKNIFIEKWINLVSVRSSSSTEDTENDSKAGAFKTYLNVNIENIDKYIDEIQIHSQNKFGYKIPIIIQEMIEGVSWIAFSTNPDSWKDYLSLNYHDWVWEDLVSWNTTWKNINIFNWSNIENIKNEMHKKIFIAMGYLKDNLDFNDLDIEFVYKWNSLHLLQVRPITKINWWKVVTDNLTKRYVNFVSYVLSKNEKILWNMIDINPEELVWKQSILIKSFFWHIFPETSLRKARKDLWYKDSEDFYNLILDKVYVDLEKNIASFLPISLDNKEEKIFVNYYKNLISIKPELQNRLDLNLYPNNIEKVFEILDCLGINKNEKNIILNKFITHFKNLEQKIVSYSNNYKQIENKLFWEIGVNNFYDLINLKDFEWDLNNLLDLIKKTTYFFSIYARFFFYLSNKWYKENPRYFKNNIYETEILKTLSKIWKNSIDFEISEWFNFMNILKQSFSLDNQIIEDKNFEFNSADICKVARENLKFLFMNLFKLLWQKIQSQINNKDFDLNDINFLNFQDLLDFLDWKINSDKIKLKVVGWKTKNKISKFLDFPTVITKNNTLIENSPIWNNWFYCWSWLLEWEICIIDDINDFNEKEYKWKIVIIENATPEIDVYLKNIKWIITKNWWPLAHIMIRAREFWIPAVVWTSKYSEILKKTPWKIKIDFKNKSLFIN